MIFQSYGPRLILTMDGKMSAKKHTNKLFEIGI